MDSLLEALPLLFLRFPVLILAIVFHEVAHGWAAFYWGDPTAKEEGRLTFNPIPHIDLLGTLILPSLSLLFPGSSILVGWAKPVPIRPTLFRNYKQGMITVALAGPFMNFFLGFFSAFLCTALRAWVPEDFFLFDPLLQMGYISTFMNFFIGFFNLIPLPPLDGSKILATLLPYSAAQKYEAISAYQFYIFMALLLSGALSLLQYPSSFFAIGSFRFFERLLL